MIIKQDIEAFVPTGEVWDLEFNTLTKNLEQKREISIVAGDNNANIILIKTPLSYNGIELNSTNCIVKYKTSWNKADGNPNEGQIDLTKFVKKFEDCLIYSWSLDQRQTLYSGNCVFSIEFLMNLDDDPYQDTSKFHLSSEKDNKGVVSISVVKESVDEELKKNYWSFSSLPFTLMVSEGTNIASGATIEDVPTMVDQTYSPNSVNAQSGKAVAEAVSRLVPKTILSDPGALFSSILAVNNSDYDYADYSPNNSSYHYIRVHNVDYAGTDVESMYNYANMLAQHDRNGNLSTGMPIDGRDCANKAYVDNLAGGNKFVEKVKGNGHTFQVYATDDSDNEYGDTTLTVENNSMFKHGFNYGTIPRRQSNGNLFTNSPVDELDCVNKYYVDNKIGYDLSIIENEISDINTSLNMLYSETTSGDTIYENELVGTGKGYETNGLNSLVINRNMPSQSNYDLFIGTGQLAPSVYYGNGSTTRCIEIPLGNYTSGQLDIIIDYEALDIETSIQDTDRVMHVCIKYTDGSTVYLTIVPIIDNGSYSTTITTESGKNVSNVYIEKHARWTSGKIIITNVVVLDNFYGTDYWHQGAKRLSRDYRAYNKDHFELNFNELYVTKPDKIYIADNVPGKSQYTVVTSPQDIQEEINEIQTILPMLMGRGITSELVKPGIKTVLDFNAAYVLVSGQLNIGIRGKDGEIMQDTSGAPLPIAKLCILILPNETKGETSRRLCYHMASDGVDATAKHFYVSNDNEVSVTLKDSNLTIFKVSF